MTAPRLVASTADLSRDDWLTLRRQGIGASDIAAVLDLDPWKSPWALYLDKIGELPDDEPSEAMHFGQVLEQVVAAEFEARTDWHVYHPHAIYAHANHDWMLCTPDRFIAKGDADRVLGLLECKNVTAYKADEWRDSHDGPQAPAHYLLQVQWAMAVTGCSWGYLAALIGGNRFIYLPVPRDDELISMLIDEAAGFWQRVCERRPPPIDGSDSTEEALKRLYAEADPDSVVELPAEAEQWLDGYWSAQAAIKDAEEHKRRHANRLRAALGDAEAGCLPGEEEPCVTWKQGTRTTLSQDAVKSEFPEIASKCTRTTVTRTLRPKKRTS